MLLRTSSLTSVYDDSRAACISRWRPGVFVLNACLDNGDLHAIGEDPATGALVSPTISLDVIQRCTSPLKVYLRQQSGLSCGLCHLPLFHEPVPAQQPCAITSVF